MEKAMQKVKAWLPGILLSVVIAAAAKWLEGLLPAGIISASVIALFLGAILNALRKTDEVYAPGVHFTSKKLLKFAIILLGASLNITTIMQVGGMSLLVMAFTLLTCFGGGYFIGKALKLNWKMSNLISAGTGICGGSAIAAIAPVIDAEDTDIAFAMSATFLFDMIMILLFPVMGRWLHLSDTAYGLWSGTAVNDTASVVAAGYSYSMAAGDFAVMVKLTRTLSIIPTVLVFAFVHMRMQNRALASAGSATRSSVLSAFPLFIVGFLVLAGINSMGLMPAGLSAALKEISRFLMVTALAAIGLNADFGKMRKSGVAPMLHGLIISALVVIVALAAIRLEQWLGMMV